MKRTRQTLSAEPGHLLDAVEQALDGCRNTATLARLLTAAGASNRAEALDADLVAYTGELMLEQIRQVEATLRTMKTVRDKV